MPTGVLPTIDQVHLQGYSPTVEPGTYECYVREVVLCHLYRLPSLLETVLDNPYMPVIFSHPTHEGAWNALRTYFTKYRCLPSPEAICADMQLTSRYEFEELVSIQEVLSRWANLPFNYLKMEFARDLLNTLLREECQRALAAQIRDADPSDLIDVISRAATDLTNHTTTNRVVAKNPFWGSPEENLFQVAKIGFGIDWMDAALCGGSRPGELTGFVMPSKAGKTTIVWQLAEASVMQGQNVVVYSFEQPLEGDQTQRAFVRAADNTREEWTTNSLDCLSPDSRARFETNKELWSRHLRVIDAWTEPERELTSTAQMFQPMNDLIADGWIPQKALFDWWGLLVAKLHLSNLAKGDQIMRMQERVWLAEMSGYLRLCGTQGVLFHQKTGASNKKGVSFVGSSHDSQGSSDFNNLLHHCFVSSRKDSDGTVIMKLDVSRDSGNPTCRLKLDAARCLLVATGAEYDMDFDEPTITGMSAEPDGFDTADVFGQTA